MVALATRNEQSQEVAVGSLMAAPVPDGENLVGVIEAIRLRRIRHSPMMNLFVPHPGVGVLGGAGTA